MFTSSLWIEGADFNAQATARRLKLGKDYYSLRGDRYELGPRKGKPRLTSILRVPLSDHRDHDRHLRQLQTVLEKHLTFLSSLRSRHEDALSMCLSIGLTVGGQRYFTRSFSASPELMSMLVALRIKLSISAYPISDHRERKSLKWSDGVGLTP